MNLNELREAMASDATKENEELRREIASLKKRYHKDTTYLRSYCNAQLEDLKALANRCWALTHGAMCCFCGLNVFKCPHSMSFVDKLREVRKIGEENSDETGDL
jgi:hypothetical protein